MSKVMFQFEHPEGVPELDEVLTEYGLGRAEVDEEFGLIPVDRERGIYTILVDENAAARLRAATSEESPGGVTGVFSNPRIEPFGPPEP
jgi:hypothetical protein